MSITSLFPKKKGKELAATAPSPQLNDTSLNNSSASLEAAYMKQAELEDVKENVKKLFKTLRIMVVGRSGSGKTTIIRLVMGEKGPRSMSVGKAGVQDISMEWHHPDEDVPLVFHDTNGMDVLGAERLEDIRRFLEPKHKDHKADFRTKVHVVWYVFNAIDNRFLEDAGLLAMLDASYPTLPIILVMTHCDVHDVMKRPTVDDAKLEVLLGRISDPERRRLARSRMVKLRNDVQQSDTHGSIQGTADLAGLRLLIQNTKDVIGKELQLTWAAGQASDVDEKLNMSTELIISVKRKTIVWTWAARIVPILQQLQLRRALFTMTKCLGKIWKVHPNLEKAILDQLFQKEGGISTLLITVDSARAVSTLIMVYSLLLMGFILYVKALEPVAGANTNEQQQQADGHRIGAIGAAATSTNLDVHDYVYYSQLCQNFSTSKQALHLKSFVQHNKALWQSPLDEIEERQCLKVALLNCFKQIAFNRPRSLYYTPLLQENDMSCVDQRQPMHGQNSRNYNATSGAGCGSNTAL